VVAGIGSLEMATVEPLRDPPRALIAVRWVLIAVCAALIIFSHGMAGRLGFAALLVFAVILGRYSSRWFTRPRREDALGTSVEPQALPSAAEEPARHREAGQ